VPEIMALRRMTQTWESMLNGLVVELPADDGMSESGVFESDGMSESDVLSGIDACNFSDNSVSPEHTGRPSSKYIGRRSSGAMALSACFMTFIVRMLRWRLAFILYQDPEKSISRTW